jgi:hypothetical protein
LDDDAESPRAVRLEYQHYTSLAAWSGWSNQTELYHIPASIAGHPKTPEFLGHQHFNRAGNQWIDTIFNISLLV